MRITLLAVGSRGDVQPYIALGRGLQAVGHDVCLATHEVFAPLVRDYGLCFHGLAGDPRLLAQTERGRSMVASGRNPLRFLRMLRRVAAADFAQNLRDSWAACQGADVVLYSVLAAAGYHIGEKLATPAIPAFLQPLSRTRAFPMLSLPASWQLGGAFNLWTHKAAELMFWWAIRSFVNPFRVATLSLPPLPWRGWLADFYAQRRPILYGFSPLVASPPADWHENLLAAGYWFLDRPAGWQPPADLRRFLDAGPAPVYIGFGSMASRDPARLAAISLAALARSGQRGILMTGWDGLGRQAVPDSVFVLDGAPHDWLFPRCAAVVHHGGAGTTAAALRAGVPAVVVPFFGDQPFWAERVRRLGAGPAPLPQKKIDSAGLTAAIEAAVGDAQIRARAGAIGTALRAEDGVATAVNALHRWSGYESAGSRQTRTLPSPLPESMVDPSADQATPHTA